jgi:hypothetical protein
MIEKNRKKSVWFSINRFHFKLFIDFAATCTQSVNPSSSLSWEPCLEPSYKSSAKEPRTVSLPLLWQGDSSKRIDISVKRIQATQPAKAVFETEKVRGNNE